MDTKLADKLRELRLDWPDSPNPRRISKTSDGGDAVAGSRRRPLRSVTAAAAAMVALLAATAWWLAAPSTAPAPPPETASDAPADAVASPRGALAASGYVVARRSATVSALVTGQVERILVAEGQEVAAGQVLATLDGAAAAAAQDRAAAAAQAAQAHSRALAAQIGEAEREATRLQALHQRGFVADAVLSRHQANLARLRAESGAAQAEEEGAIANIRTAATIRRQHVIRAPFAGIVSAINAQPGEIVSPISAGGGFTRTGICTIVDMDSLEVEVQVAEALISRIRVGMPAAVTLKAYPDRSYRARVSAIVPVADRSRGSFGVRLEISNRDARMLPEMAVDVAFSENEVE